MQAAINAARGQLPANLPSNPTYRKVNPADAPIMILVDHLRHRTTTARMYDAASSILQQKLSQVEGVGQVIVGGGALPAVRVDVNPDRAQQLRPRPGGRRAPPSAPPTPTAPRATSHGDGTAWSLSATDQLLQGRPSTSR